MTRRSDLGGRLWSLSPARLLQVFAGSLVLGVGVAMVLVAELGADGYTTLVNGVARSVGVSFWLANLGMGVLLLLLAAARRVYPGPGTVVQVAVVGVTVSVLLEIMVTPSAFLGQAALLVAALPVLAVGIAAYLGSHTGAGPAEAAALAWDPPMPFRWSYGLVQGGGALGGWLLGATLGVGTLVVVVLLGPSIALASRLLRLDVHQRPTADDRSE